MREVFTMWRHTNMIVLVALSAAMYAALLIPFQSIPIIPGHVSLRVANILPVALGLLFGPAGAWGAAIGNLIGDMFGTLSPGAIGGFVSNFMTAFLAYKLWNALSPRRDMGINLTSGRRLLRYEINVVIQVCATTLILTWWVALLLGLAPAEFYFAAVILGGLLPKALITPFVVRILYPRVRKWGLLWTEILAPDEVSAGPFRKMGLALTSAGALAGSGLLVFTLYFSDLETSSNIARFLPVPFILLIFAGSVLMGGREQVAAMAEERAEASDGRLRLRHRSGTPTEERGA